MKISLILGLSSVMNKALFFWLSLALLLSSCVGKEDARSLGTDRLNSVSVIIDDNLWLGTIGDSMRNKLAQPVIGLDQEEPRFSLNQFPARLLEGYQSQSRNIIVIKKDPKLKQTVYRLKTDQFFSPQNIFSISGPTTADILASFETHSPDIIRKIRAVELAVAQKNLRSNKSDLDILKKKFNIELDFPISYKLALQKRNFVWLKKEITSGSSSILVYQVPDSQLAGGENMLERLIHQRDNTVRKYVRGVRPRTPMVTENSFAPYFNKLNIRGYDAFEIRGTWELQNDFMQGPFLLYCVHDKQNKRYIFLEGFCYAPSRAKRDLIFELEAILQTVRFQK